MLGCAFLRGISSQAQDSLVRMQRLEAIRTKYEPLVKSDRNSVRMGVVLDFLFARPILSAKQLAENVGMPFKTARKYIEKLANARNQIHRADEIFGAMDKIQE